MPCGCGALGAGMVMWGKENGESGQSRGAAREEGAVNLTAFPSLWACVYKM